MSILRGADGAISPAKVAANLVLPGSGALFDNAPKPPKPAPAPEPAAPTAPPSSGLACPKCGCTTFRQDAKTLTKVAWGVWAKKHLYCARCGKQVDK